MRLAQKCEQALRMRRDALVPLLLAAVAMSCGGRSSQIAPTASANGGAGADIPGSQGGAISAVGTAGVGGPTSGRAGSAGAFIVEGGTSGSTAASAGTGGVGTGGKVTVSSGGSGDAAGADSAGAGGSDEVSSCDWYALWDAIKLGAASLGGKCEIEDPPYTGTLVESDRGELIFDHEGRVIDNTGLTGQDKQYWLAMLANQRWTCLADQTIGYKCEQPAPP